MGLQNTKGKGSDMDTNGLSAEQQALLASIMGKSSQAGGGGFNPSTPASAGGPSCRTRRSSEKSGSKP